MSNSLLKNAVVVLEYISFEKQNNLFLVFFFSFDSIDKPASSPSTCFWLARIKQIASKRFLYFNFDNTALYSKLGYLKVILFFC